MAVEMKNSSLRDGSPKSDLRCGYTGQNLPSNIFIHPGDRRTSYSTSIMMLRRYSNPKGQAIYADLENDDAIRMAFQILRTVILDASQAQQFLELSVQRAELSPEDHIPLVQTVCEAIEAKKAKTQFPRAASA